MSLGLRMHLGLSRPSNGAASNPYAAYALALDFDDQDYWSGGTEAANLAALPGYSFTRSGQQGAVDASGAVQYFAANVPAINSAGYHAYGALTNLNIDSQTFQNWTTDGGGSVTANTQVSPDGATNADTLTGGAANGSKYIYHLTAASYTAGSTTNVRILKMGTQRFAQLVFGGTSNATAYANFDLQLGTVAASGGGGTGYIVPLANGWYICVLVATTAAASDFPIGPVWIDSGVAARLPTHTGGATTLYCYQAQNLTGNFPDGGPIIVTAGATASIGGSVLNTTVNPYAVDTDFFVWVSGDYEASTNGASEVLLRFGDQSWFGRGGGGNLVISDALAPVPNNEDVVAQGAGTVTIGLRRRAGSCTAFFKRVDGTVITKTETAVAWPAMGAALRVGHYSGAQQADGAVEGIFARTGTFSDAQCQAIMAAA